MLARILTLAPEGPGAPRSPGAPCGGQRESVKPREPPVTQGETSWGLDWRPPSFSTSWDETPVPKLGLEGAKCPAPSRTIQELRGPWDSPCCVCGGLPGSDPGAGGLSSSPHGPGPFLPVHQVCLLHRGDQRGRGDPGGGRKGVRHQRWVPLSVPAPHHPPEATPGIRGSRRGLVLLARQQGPGGKTRAQ